MGSLRETNPSLWVGTTEAGGFLPSALESRFDVVVVGAGITGSHHGRLLAADGATVAVLEAGDVAAGATGYTTAKLTALQRTTLSEIRGRLGPERAAAYAAANSAAVETVARLVADDAIDCQHERASACTYTTDPSGSCEPSRTSTTPPERRAGHPARRDHRAALRGGRRRVARRPSAVPSPAVLPGPGRRARASRRCRRRAVQGHRGQRGARRLHHRGPRRARSPLITSSSRRTCRS